MGCPVKDFVMTSHSGLQRTMTSWISSWGVVTEVNGKKVNSYFACSPEEFCEYFFRVCLGILH